MDKPRRRAELHWNGMMNEMLLRTYCLHANFLIARAVLHGNEFGSELKGRIGWDDGRESASTFGENQTA